MIFSLTFPSENLRLVHGIGVLPVRTLRVMFKFGISFPVGLARGWKLTYQERIRG